MKKETHRELENMLQEFWNRVEALKIDEPTVRGALNRMYHRRQIAKRRALSYVDYLTH